MMLIAVANPGNPALLVDVFPPGSKWAGGRVLAEFADGMTWQEIGEWVQKLNEADPT